MGWCETLHSFLEPSIPTGLQQAQPGHHINPPALLRGMDWRFSTWVWICDKVKCLMDPRASTDIIASGTVQRIPGWIHKPHEQAIRVRVAAEIVYDANTFVRPRHQAEATKGPYSQKIELRVMPIDMCVAVILGGP
ncbi:hypothetical protein CYMTET_41456 [Cymbomonas tetramitiformis]|uniref:Uncharacterized protein n=1 Tax=Cymbomonas tetramitiformis TaxID=36881 RepID=A0AAE0C637_9CHLO|nr:hypothetical protein CYMTET_41456 [Cymbomonas tetramitiformis]